MTEFKRTTEAVVEIEQLVQAVLDGDSVANVLRLSELVGSTGAVVAKLLQKASETDPNKATYGPQMKEKVLALGEHWGTVEGLARDVLHQRGATVVVPETRSAAGVSAPNNGNGTLPARLAPGPGSMAAIYSGAAMSTPTAASHQSSGTSIPSVGGASSNATNRREIAAHAAEARLRGGAVSGQTAATGSSANASSVAQAHPVIVVGRMDSLLHLVHCVFLGHGFTRADEASTVLASGPAPIRVRYVHKSHKPIEAVYIPVQNHLIIYASLDGSGAAPSRAAVQIGMAAQSVQAKVDYLLVCPLLYRHCIPALPSLPNEVTFGILTNLALPSLKALGCTSKNLAYSVFEDEILWWRVLLALPSSSSHVEEALAAHRRGEALPKGTFRRLVKEEVAQARAEAEEQRERREAERRMRDRMRDAMNDPLRVGPPRRPQPGFPGFPGGGIIGGDYDLMPGGGFMPPGPFGNGRRGPYGDGGGFGGFGM